jgi:hypothetical protein
MKYLFILIIMGLALPNLLAQESSNPGSDEMAAMMAAAAPGPEHAMLAKGVGEWTTVQTLWMPGADAVKSTGTTSVESVLGGRFVLSHDKGTAMGQPYEGMAILGYDNTRKVFTMAWRSTMETSVTHGLGTYDEATKTITYKGKMLTMAGEVDYRFESKWIDEDHITDTMYVDMGGQDYKMMEIASTRVK